MRPPIRANSKISHYLRTDRVQFLRSWSQRYARDSVSHPSTTSHLMSAKKGQRHLPSLAGTPWHWDSTFQCSNGVAVAALGLAACSSTVLNDELRLRKSQEHVNHLVQAACNQAPAMVMVNGQVAAIP